MARRRRRLPGGWLVLAAASAILPAYLTATPTAFCLDKVDPSRTLCDTSTLVGPYTGWFAWGLWVLFALWCLFRALRRPRIARSTPPSTRADDGSTPRIGAHTAVEIALPGRGGVQLAYAPTRNGRPDAGEVVWAWVPFHEDPTRGKDRPLLIIATHDAQRVLAMKLTSRSRDHQRDFLGIGAGRWDAQGRPSWVDVDQLYLVHRSGIRREAGALPAETFDRVQQLLVERYGWVPR